MKALLVLQSYLLLINIDLRMRLRSVRAVHSLVQRQRTASTLRHPDADIAAVCHAMDIASVLYVKPVLCLQRSAATAILLRRYGWRAEMVIGAQIIPFRSHAWVEVNGQVVNDKPYMHEIYRVLERCQAE
jgi:hypothetical protein